MRMKLAQPIRKVAIVGGTHGNELTGIYLVKKFEQYPDLIQRTSFECSTLIANPRAFEQNKRYIEKDLNRCFSSQNLASEDTAFASYEDRRAKAIAQKLAPNSKQGVDLIIDLHSTTANMGLTIIPSSPAIFNLKMAAHLSDRNPQVKVYCWPQSGSHSGSQTAFLRSLCPLGCAIEVGPVAQGLIDAKILQEAEAAVTQILDYVEAYNCKDLCEEADSLTIYQAINTVDYPRNSHGDLQASIHPMLQSRDYEPIAPGDPMFLGFDREVITYTGRSVVYPTFINEAAYYEKGIAMCLTQKEQLPLLDD